MKFYIHPKRKKTLIQRKDGRTYRKNWVYFRTLLRTENEEKSWNVELNSVTTAVAHDKVEPYRSVKEKDSIAKLTTKGFKTPVSC